jgi:spore maturation protein CgeB
VRIFYASDHSPNELLRGSQLWYKNLFLPMVDLGHDLVPFDYDLSPHFRHLEPKNPAHAAFIAENRPKTEEALLEQVRRAHAEKPLDVFFSYFYSAICRPEVIREIKSMGIVTMNWYCNASYQFDLIEELAPAYDHCLVPEAYRLDDYRRAGAHPVYFQEAANPTFYHPMDVPQEYDMTFVGMRYGDRPDFVEHLWRRGLEVNVWGPGWRDALAAPPPPLWRRALSRTRLGQGKSAIPERAIGAPLSDEDMVALYSKSRVSLGFSSCGETHKSGERILQIRLRDFEGPMCGAFYMMEDMEEMYAFFEPDREMVFYRDKEHLADLANFYLQHDAARERIRAAGHKRAVAEHSWQTRFEKLFASLNLS